MQVSASYPLAGMPTIHGNQQWLDIHQPVIKVPEYQPIVKRVEGITAYQKDWFTLSKRLWIC
jgi:hypothetical protein